MTNPIAAFRTFVQRNEFKRRAANPENLVDHAVYLLERQDKGKDGQIYVKKGGLFGLGSKRLSSKKPWIGKEKASNAYDRLLGQIAQKNLDTNGATTKAGLTAQNLSVVRQRALPANEQEAAAHTKELEQLVINLARQKNGIENTADDKVLTSALRTKQSIPAVAKPKVSAIPDNAKEDLPAFPTTEELGAFKRDLERGFKKLPAYPDVTRFVMHLNQTENTTADRRFPSGERNEVKDLLAYIADNVTSIHTWKEGEGLVGRPTNTFGDLTFNSRREAADFLFTKTDFFKDLNPRDAAVYMGIYQDRIKESKQEQQRVG
jgi:hypothetical protein